MKRKILCLLFSLMASKANAQQRDADNQASSPPAQGIVSAPVDWKFAYMDAARGGKPTICFFEETSMKKIQPATFRLWIKCLLVSDAVNVDKKLKKAMLDDSRERIAAGYVPPAASLLTHSSEKTLKEFSAETAAFEVMADKGGIPPYSASRLEVSCDKQKFRLLSTDVTNGPVEVQSSQDWQDIPSEAPMRPVVMLVCRS